MPDSLSKRLIAVMGPTASGKTDLAINLAQHLKTEIISVDARQFYRETEIATAKPTNKQLASVKHHFINSHSIEQKYSAGEFAADASALLDYLFKKYDTVIAVGGSTLYYKAFLHGIDVFPEVSLKVRENINMQYEMEGISYLQKELKIIDPMYYARVDVNNPGRLKRALEVYQASGKPYSTFLSGTKRDINFELIKIGLDIPREKLYKNINQRCDEMLEKGLIEEVKSLYPKRQYQALHTVGYKEFFEYLDDKISLTKAIELFKQHTRNYAKRQMTWLRKEEGIQWFSRPDFDEILSYIKSDRHLV